MNFGLEYGRGTPAIEAEELIHRFIEVGGNSIDTANIYAGGRAEEIVGKALKGKRSQVLLATKVRFRQGPGYNESGLSRHHIMQAVHASLRRLQTDYLDVYYMHCWDPLTPLEETLRAFEDLVVAGKIRYIGISNFKAWHLMKALALSDARGWSRAIAAQYQYSLIQREIEYEFDDLFCREEVGLLTWAPLGGGFLSGKYHQTQRPLLASDGRLATMRPVDEDAWERRSTERNWRLLTVINQIANTHGITAARVALTWLRKQPLVTSVILGPRTMGQLEENLAATETELSEDEMALLSQISTPQDVYPYRFIREFGKREI